VTLRLADATAPTDSSAQQLDGSHFLTCALVNNMPDGAFDATERQYLDLLDSASGPLEVVVRRYTMAGVPRGPQTAQRISREYSSLTDIYLDPPDCLIITGSNPIEIHLEDEPYWDDLEELLVWARNHVGSMLLSCLSAHAALTVYDSIKRVRLPSKCTGVFQQTVEVGHSLSAGFDTEILLPHSRWNSVPQEYLAQAGYDIVIHSDTTGWSVASRQEGTCQLVLVQGHPEYDPSSLLREYRRDAERYVNHERDDLPFLPFHCVSSEDWEELDRLHHEIVRGAREPRLIDEYPFEEVGGRAPWPWRTMAQTFYANWLTSVGQERE
jgi:homoserine O-succinyltransferase